MDLTDKYHTAVTEAALSRYSDQFRLQQNEILVEELSNMVASLPGLSESEIETLQQKLAEIVAQHQKLMLRL